MNAALNPYESPAAVEELTPEQLHAIRRKQLQLWLAVPALAFIVLGLVQGASAFALTVAFLSQQLPARDPDLFWMTLLILSDGLFMLAVVWAGYRMHQLRSLVYVRGISLACCIPILSPFCLLGIPFAMWALIILSQRRAETFFAENELPGTNNQAPPI